MKEKKYERLLAKDYLCIERDRDGFVNYTLTKRTLHPAYVRDVYAETVRYFAESERSAAADPPSPNSARDGIE